MLTYQTFMLPATLYVFVAAMINQHYVIYYLNSLRLC